MTVYIGIDPGTSSVNPLAIAIAVTDKDGSVRFIKQNDNGRDVYVREIKLGSGNTDFYKKVLAINSVIYNLGNIINSDDVVVGIEKPFIGVNRSGSITLAIVTGVIYSAIINLFSFVSVKFIAPMSAKKCMTGSGKATKKDIIESAERVYGLCGLTKDQADAVSMVHYLINGCSTKKKKSKKR